MNLKVGNEVVELSLKTKFRITELKACACTSRASRGMLRLKTKFRITELKDKSGETWVYVVMSLKTKFRITELKAHMGYKSYILLMVSRPNSV